MPSPLAHSVAGYLFAQVFPLDLSPNRESRVGQLELLWAIFLANAPDLDFIPQIITGQPLHRGLTHSLPFLLLGCAIAAIAPWITKKIAYRPAFFWTTGLYACHLLLDFFTQGRGIPLFLPFSATYFSSPLPLFLGFDLSLGLLHVRHLFPLSLELVYAAVILWGVKRFHQSPRQPPVPAKKDS